MRAEQLLAQVDGQRSAPSSVSLSYALTEWMRTSGIEDNTRHTCDREEHDRGCAAGICSRSLLMAPLFSWRCPMWIVVFA
ncbi:hypothetical protein [Saccharopolyspora sp. NPDC002686]|uniref:hypothetical protein n=1 Tax=Saccharopolyspora sp. NPDC002686 TaxID=3154541 RepID=UPI00331F7800